MARPAGIPCTVVYASEFEVAAKALEPDYKRLDEMLNGAEWVIARSGLRGLVEVVVNPGAGAPRLIISAEVTDDQATITEITAFPE